jgi:Inositol monophosphatase family
VYCQERSPALFVQAMAPSSKVPFFLGGAFSSPGALRLWPVARVAGALSRGDAALFLRFPAPSYREKIWDHAAGAVIVREAGGAITDAGGAPLDFSNGR